MYYVDSVCINKYLGVCTYTHAFFFCLSVCSAGQARGHCPQGAQDSSSLCPAASALPVFASLELCSASGACAPGT